MPPDLKVAIATAPISFVGTVSSTANDDRWARVTVEEVWTGPDQPVDVVVVGAMSADGISPDDRTFNAGTRYLFLPSQDADGTLRDGGCSGTMEWDQSLAVFRPASARLPTETPASGLADALVPVGVAVLAAGVLLVVGLAARGREAD